MIRKFSTLAFFIGIFGASLIGCEKQEIQMHDETFVDTDVDDDVYEFDLIERGKEMPKDYVSSNKNSIPSIITSNANDSVVWSTPWKIQEWLNGYGLHHGDSQYYAGQLTSTHWLRGKAWLFQREDGSKFVMMQSNDNRWLQIQKSQKCGISKSWTDYTCFLSTRWITGDHGANLEDFMNGQLYDTSNLEQAFQSNTLEEPQYELLDAGDLVHLGFGQMKYTGKGQVTGENETFYHFVRSTSTSTKTFNVWMHVDNSTSRLTAFITSYLDGSPLTNEDLDNLWSRADEFESDTVFKQQCFYNALGMYGEVDSYGTNLGIIDSGLVLTVLQPGVYAGFTSLSPHGIWRVSRVNCGGGKWQQSGPAPSRFSDTKVLLTDTATEYSYKDIREDHGQYTVHVFDLVNNTMTTTVYWISNDEAVNPGVVSTTNVYENLTRCNQ